MQQPRGRSSYFINCEVSRAKTLNFSYPQEGVEKSMEYNYWQHCAPNKPLPPAGQLVGGQVAGPVHLAIGPTGRDSARATIARNASVARFVENTCSRCIAIRQLQSCGSNTMVWGPSGTGHSCPTHATNSRMQSLW